MPRQLSLRGFGPSPVGWPVQAELARLRVKVVVDPRPGGCHHWVGAIGDDGYGRFQAGSGPTARTVRPHVRLFELTYGLRPVGVPLLHSCDETGCVAVGHLSVGTQALNVAQMHRRGRSYRRHTSVVDRRGPAGRARAIRAALAGGWDQATYDAALTAGDPFTGQFTLPIDAPDSTPVGSGPDGVILPARGRAGWATGDPGAALHR